MIGLKQTTGTGYTPYFYQAGQYLWKPLSASTTPQKLYKEQSGGYDFTTEMPAFYRPQTVEQIIQKGYLGVRNAEPETAILSDKHNTLWQGLDDIIQQVRHRYEIYNANIRQVEMGKCYIITDLFRREAYRGGAPADSKEQYMTTKQLQELYMQERDERVRLWQDVSKLKLLLPENARQFLSAHRKMSILEDQRSDLN
ncbi:MAG: hypothetical protein WCW64_00635 [Phycisphaerae bacterium]|jgi:hypothetical protein